MSGKGQYVTRWGGIPVWKVLVTIAVVGVIALLVRIGIEQTTPEGRAAKAAGFFNSTEMKNAAADGFSSPTEWAAFKEKRRADADRAAAAVKADDERQKAVANAKFNEAIRYAVLLRESMKNPDSFKLEGATRTITGAYCMTYRATNSFNAIVPGSAVFSSAGFASTGDPQFAALWKSVCAGKTGDDLETVVYAMNKGWVPRKN